MRQIADDQIAYMQHTGMPGLKFCLPSSFTALPAHFRQEYLFLFTRIAARQRYADEHHFIFHAFTSEG